MPSVRPQLENIADLQLTSSLLITLPASKINIGSQFYSTQPLTCSIAVVGVGGLEATVVNNTTYYVYAVAPGGVPSLIASTSSSGPSGYSPYKLVGQFKTGVAQIATVFNNSFNRLLADADVPVVTDWVSYTPTLVGVGTATGINFKYRRVGDTIQVTGAFQTGTPTAVQVTVSLPYGTIDSAKINENATIGNLTRQTTLNQAASILARTGLSLSVVYVGGEYQNTQLGLTPQNGNSMFGPGEYVAVEFFYPAAGLSSTQTLAQQLGF